MSKHWTVQYMGTSDTRVFTEEDIKTVFNVPAHSDLIIHRMQRVEISALLADKLTGMPDLIVRPPVKEDDTDESKPEADDKPVAKKASGTTRKAPKS